MSSSPKLLLVDFGECCSWWLPAKACGNANGSDPKLLATFYFSEVKRNIRAGFCLSRQSPVEALLGETMPVGRCPS